MGVVIRRATVQDAGELARIGAELFEQTYSASIPADELAAHVESDFGLAQQSAELDDPRIVSFLVERDGVVLGFAQLRRKALPVASGPSGEVELWRIYLDRELHGAGIARKLLAELGEVARGMGASGVWLAVWERNTRAISFYAKHGFERVGRQDFHVGGEVHCDLVLRAPADALRGAAGPARVPPSRPAHDRESRSGARDAVLDWLLDSDPSIRWQVMRDLMDAPSEEVTAERARVATEGWGAHVLDLQRPDGQWGDGEAHPFWWTNLYTLLWLRDLGIDPAGERVRSAIELVRDNVTWGPEFGNSPFFEGEVEPCINGRVVALAAYWGIRSDALVDRLLGEQLEDGGWNCEAERGSVRSSFHSTICVLEGLLAYELAFGAAAAVMEARRVGEEYLLERRLLRRLSTGDVIDPTWTRLAFPPLWHYDVLRALDYFRAAGVAHDERMAEGIGIVAERRGSDGRWSLDLRHRDTLYPEMAGPVGEPSRWVTLRALRVPRRAEQDG